MLSEPVKIEFEIASNGEFARLFKQHNDHRDDIGTLYFKFRCVEFKQTNTSVLRVNDLEQLVSISRQLEMMLRCQKDE